MKKTEEDRILTKRETAKYLRVSTQTLESLMNENQISYIKLKRKVFFRQSDIDAFLETRRHAAKPKKS